MLKKKPQNQSFKFPFKNHSLTQDAEVEFYFVRLPNKFKKGSLGLGSDSARSTQEENEIAEQ